MNNLSLFDLTGKVALVTGAAQGLGQGIAEGLAQAGAIVVCLDKNPLSETLGRIEQMDGEAYAIHGDLFGLTPITARRIIEDCVETAGRLDIMVNNAGIIRRSPAVDFSADDWYEVLDIDLNSVFFLSQAMARHCIREEQRGKIINLASMLSFQGGMNVPAYAAAKSGVLGLTRALANEWAHLGINVNALAPGYFVTDVTSAIRANEERNRSVLARIPAGRWGEPSDLQGAAVFLASSASDYVHGTALPVDGGWLSN